MEGKGAGGVLEQLADALLEMGELVELESGIFDGEVFAGFCVLVDEYAALASLEGIDEFEAFFAL